MSADPPEPAAASGPDLVRKALAEAKAAARERGVAAAGGRKAVRKLPRRRGEAGDPVRFGEAIQRLVDERGWQDTTTNAGVLANWASLVGPEIADHCQPLSLVDGELVLVAESTAWATQLRLLTRTLQAKLREQVGDGVVHKVVVRGPAQPDWRRGPRRVQGRGPRDTYG
ncbi:MAG TPA: DciA family protein [Mycobacteriales bacterium]|nr:DciA family protein [Mycobacteriales bacterium]